MLSEVSLQTHGTGRSKFYLSFLSRFTLLSNEVVSTVLTETCQAKSGQTVTVAVSGGEGAGGHAPKLFPSPTVILGEWLAMQQPCFWH